MFKVQEKILLHQVKNGNQQAFAKLYDFYLNKIYRFVYFRVSDENLAQDLTNDTFAKILNYLNNDQEIEDFQSFLYRTARNLVIDFYRQKGQMELSIDEFIKDNIAEEKNVIQELENKFEVEKIKEDLLILPDPYREAIVLRFVEDMSFKEIAKIMDLREDHARMLVHRGLKVLREKLKSSENINLSEQRE